MIGEKYIPRFKKNEGISLNFWLLGIRHILRQFHYSLLLHAVHYYFPMRSFIQDRFVSGGWTGGCTGTPRTARLISTVREGTLTAHAVIRGSTTIISFRPATTTTDNAQVQITVKISYPKAVADLRGARGTLAPPPGSKFFQFHAVFGKIWQNRMLAHPLGSWRSLIGEILDPPLEGVFRNQSVFYISVFSLSIPGSKVCGIYLLEIFWNKI